MSVDLERKLVEALKLNWEHARHLETLRMRLTTVCIATGAALGAASFGVGNQWIKAAVILFALVITCSCALAVHKLNLEFSNQIKSADRCARKLIIENKDGKRTSSLHDFIGFPIRDKTIRLISLEWLSVRWIFYAMYIIFVAIWTSYLLVVIFQPELIAQ